MTYSENLNELPIGAFIPTYLEHWAVIKKFMPEVPAVEIDLTANGGLAGEIYCWHDAEQNPAAEEFYPEAIDLVTDDGKKVCIIDQRLHGWDAIQCDFKPEGPRISTQWKCKSCGKKEFSSRFSWLGYQVFDEGWQNSGSELMEFRDSYDSAAVDVECLACGHVEIALFEAELA